MLYICYLSSAILFFGLLVNCTVLCCVGVVVPVHVLEAHLHRDSKDMRREFCGGLDLYHCLRTFLYVFETCLYGAQMSAS